MPANVNVPEARSFAKGTERMLKAANADDSFAFDGNSALCKGEVHMDWPDHSLNSCIGNSGEAANKLCTTSSTQALSHTLQNGAIALGIAQNKDTSTGSFNLLTPYAGEGRTPTRDTKSGRNFDHDSIQRTLPEQKVPSFQKPHPLQPTREETEGTSLQQPSADMQTKRIDAPLTPAPSVSNAQKWQATIAEHVALIDDVKGSLTLEKEKGFLHKMQLLAAWNAADHEQAESQKKLAKAEQAQNEAVRRGDELQKERTVLSAQLAEAQDKILNVEPVLQKTADTARQLNASKEQIRTLEASNIALKAKIIEIAASESNAQAALAAALSGKESLNEDLAQKREQLSVALADKVQAAQREAAAVQAQRETAAKLRCKEEELSAALSENEALAQKVAVLELDQKTLKTALHEVTEKERVGQMSLKSAGEREAAARQQVEELSNHLAQSERSKAEAEVDLADKTAALEEANQRLQESEASKAEVERVLLTKTAALEALEEKNKALEMEKKSTSVEHEATRARLKSLETSSSAMLKAVERKRIDLVQGVAQLQTEKKALQATLEEAESKLAAFRAQVQAAGESSVRQAQQDEKYKLEEAEARLASLTELHERTVYALENKVLEAEATERKQSLLREQLEAALWKERGPRDIALQVVKAKVLKLEDQNENLMLELNRLNRDRLESSNKREAATAQEAAELREKLRQEKLRADQLATLLHDSEVASSSKGKEKLEA